MERALGLAYYWQSLIESGKFDSNSAIANAEGLSKGHVNRLMQLCRLSPTKVRQCLERTPSAKLKAFTRREVSVDWDQQ